jgi:putative transposase
MVSQSGNWTLTPNMNGCGKPSEPCHSENKGSSNWEQQRQRVASIKRRTRRKVLDLHHKLTTWLVTEYDAVFVEDLDVKRMLESSQNAKNKQDAAWRQFIQLLKHMPDSKP